MESKSTIAAATISPEHVGELSGPVVIAVDVEDEE
ncbi:hypothetical protein EES39_38760 [Streptomyces sp. ADI92-24]|nr:hypothetical protein EES39_38760 [Streptomyces sp. ADI92-24]